MTGYWELVDRTWLATPEYSGCGFGHMRRFPPEVLAAWRAAMDAALAACTAITEHRRVKLADDSLRLFELFMKLRRALAEGGWRKIDQEARKYVGSMGAKADEYAENYTFGKTRWSWGGSINASYFRAFYMHTYEDAARIANTKKFTLLQRKPIREFRYKDDPDGKGGPAGWQEADFDDAAWPTTDVSMQTWSTLGLHAYMGTMWYRTTVKLGKLPEGKRILLWIGATDGNAKVFVNGAHVPYVDAEGKTTEKAAGYCKPFSFDVTAAVKAKATNQITIAATRTFINELGTGGLLAPVTFYAEK